LREKLREFKAQQHEGWGAISWSSDSEYIAKKGKDLLSVYKLPAMSLLEDLETKQGSSFKIPNIQTISWNPKKNIICAVAYSVERSKEGKNE